MKFKKFNTNKPVNEVCNEIEEMIPTVLGTKVVKEKKEKDIIYYPARRYMGTDDLMDDVSIIVRKINNSTTHIRLEDTEYLEKRNSAFGENWRSVALRRAYDKLDKVLNDMYKG